MTHLEIYRRAWGYAEDEYVPCEVCGGTAVDVHHITYRSHGGTDEIENLIGLCRACHDLAHAAKLSEEDIRKAKRTPNNHWRRS